MQCKVRNEKQKSNICKTFLHTEPEAPKFMVNVTSMTSLNIVWTTVSGKCDYYVITVENEKTNFVSMFNTI